MRAEAQAQAIELRKQGKSINQIVQLVQASKGSVSTWVRHIQLTDEQKERLMGSCPSMNRGMKEWPDKLKKQAMGSREKYQQLGREMVKINDPLFIAGCMLYWAEGSKTRTQVGFVNSDAGMVRLFIDFLKQCFNVKDNDLRIGCYYYVNDDITCEQVEQHWKNELRLPESCFNKTCSNKVYRKAKTKRAERTKFGTCRIRVHDVKIIQMIYGAIQEFSKHDNPEWVE